MSGEVDSFIEHKDDGVVSEKILEQYRQIYPDFKPEDSQNVSHGKHTHYRRCGILRPISIRYAAYTHA